MPIDFENKKIIPNPGDMNTELYTAFERIIARLSSLDGKAGKILKVGSDEIHCEWVADTGGSAAFADITGQPSDNANLAAALNGKVSDVQLNGTTIVADHVANIETVDNLTTTTLAPLSANQGKVLNDRVNNLETIGRFLSLWNCATGLPVSNPPTMPYTYKTGDYFIVSTNGSTNYRPDGTTYTGTASTTVTTENVQKGDIWRFDGTGWMFEQNHSAQDGVLDVQVNSTSIVSSGVANLDKEDTPVLNSEKFISSGGVYKRIQSGTDAPETGFSGTPVLGDVYIQYSS